MDFFSNVSDRIFFQTSTITRLADVGSIYTHIEKHLSVPVERATHLRGRPLKARVKELLQFFEKLDPE